MQNKKDWKPSRNAGINVNLFISIALMNENFDIKKFGADKIALLGLFALSLLTARVVVGLKSALVLSDPIPLRGAGISVAVPKGNGWQSQERWTRDGNTYVLNSSFSAGPGEPTAGVICRYQPAVRAGSLRMLFEQKALRFNGTIVTIDKIVTDSLIFDWAQIKAEQPPLTAFVGMAELPEDRRLDIEVFEITGNAEQAENTFRRIVESVKIKNSPLVQKPQGGTKVEDLT